jgi:hypothetical protein
MADVKTVAVRLQAINAEYKRGMSEAGDSTAQFARVSTVALAAAAVAVVGLVKGAADSTVEYGKQIMRMSRLTGESVETMSRLSFAAQQTGVSSDQLANGMKFLEKNMAAGKEEFAQLGINVKDSSGHLRSSHEVLLDAADAIHRMGSGAQATAAAMALFGRAGQNLLPLLARGRQGILELEAAAAKYGLVFDEHRIESIQAYVRAHRELDAAMQGAKLRIGEEVLPVLTALTQAYAQLPGPISSAIVPVTGGVVALAAFAKVAGAVKTAGEGVVSTVTQLGKSMSGMDAAISAGAAVGIAVILKGLHDVTESAQDLQRQFSAGIDWTSYAKAAEGINREAAEVNRLADQWNNYNAIQKLNNAGDYKRYNDLAAQLEEDQRHYDETTRRIHILGSALGITGSAAQKLTDSMHVDLTRIDPAVYTPIFRALASGQITAAQAAEQLAGAQRQAAQTSEEDADAKKAQRDATKAANDEEKAAIEPQLAYISASRKLTDAQQNARTASRDVARAEQDLADAHDKVTVAERRRDDAARKVTDAIAAQRDAQRALNDALRGPSVNEQLDVEAARISLDEARRRARGETGTDPALEKRRNDLEVRRAEMALKDAEGAHDRNVAAARKNLSAADQALADAQQAQQDAVRGVRDANDALGDYEEKVTVAQGKAADAQTAIAQANIDLDIAGRNLMTSFATADASMLTNTKTLEIWVQQGRLTRDMADELKRKFEEMRTAAENANPDTGGVAPAPAAPGGFAGVATSGQVTNFGGVSTSGTGTVAGTEHHWWAPHAAGGALDEGWNMVGEQGPELVYKRGGMARVASTPVTRGLLAVHPFSSPPAGASSAAGGGGYVHNGDIVIGRATERTAYDIVWEQRKLALSVARR